MQTNHFVDFEQHTNTHWQINTREGHSLHLHVITDHIFRFRWATDVRDFSYAIDPDFTPEAVNAQQAGDENYWSVSTAALSCRIHKEDMLISMYDQYDTLISQDVLSYHKQGDTVSSHKATQPDEAFFGLGDKADDFNIRGKRFENWGTDAFRYQKGTDPLYRNIPFYIGLNQEQAYGIFLDNSHRTIFDFGQQDKQQVQMSAEGGEMNYYFIAGPGMQQVAERYTLLTGRPELPPLWGLGYHQCKWSYYPESNVREIATQFRKQNFPCDAIYLDIDYMDGYRCFTWNEAGFPDPAGMIADLKADGFKTVVILDPGIKIDDDYSVYQEGIEGDFFCKLEDGTPFQGNVWPGPCHFPDFTKPDTRAWWKGQVKKLVEAGVSGIWNDMNEPSVFETENTTMPAEVIHDYEGEPVPHAQAHNVYGMQMARATYEGLKKWRPNHRPFVITRSGYSGLQRYTLVWTGDNTASWAHMWLASIQCQRLSLSGVSYVGTDIGGFIEDSEPELFVRWIQLGAFHPLFRTHSMADKADMAPNLDDELREAIRGGANREPWAFGQVNGEIIKKYISLRYRLLPYMYTAFWQYATQGTPILRPLVMLDQAHPYFATHAENFAVGDHLVVVPVLEAGNPTLKLQLPAGQWYYYWDDTQYAGRKDIRLTPELATMPVFARAGAVIAHQPLMQYTHQMPIDQLTLDVYFGKEETVSQLYEDAGEGYDYEKGSFKRKRWSVRGSDRTMHIEQEAEGDFVPSYNTYFIRLHGLPFAPTTVTVDGQVKEWQVKDDVLQASISEGFTHVEIS